MTTFQPRLSNARVEPLTSTAGSIPLGVKTASLTFDATWSPYIQGTMTCTRQSAADATATDPRKAACVKFTMSQQVDDNPRTSSDLVTYLRSRTTSFATDETVLTFASIESMMQDHVDIPGQQYDAAVSDLDMNRDALNRMTLFNSGVLTVDNSAGPASFKVAAAQAGWDAGTSLWDVVNGYEATGNVWMHGSESGLVLFRHPVGYSADASTYYVNNNRVISGGITDTVDRNDPNFADSVFINYVTAKGAYNNTDYGVVGSPTFYKMQVINRVGKMAQAGEAKSRAQRMSKRGRTLVVTTPWDLALRPNRPIYVAYQDVAWYGTVRAVTFRHPDAVMDVTIDVTDA